MMKRLLLSALSLVVLLSGCQTWGPTWSEVTGQKYNRAILFRQPALIERIDDGANWPTNDPNIKIEPGQHRVVVQGIAPQPRPGGGNLEVFMLDAKPCIRYYLNAQYPNLIDPEFKVVIDFEEPIAGCKIVPAK
jgi:hypothetical protein